MSGEGAYPDFAAFFAAPIRTRPGYRLRVQPPELNRVAFSKPPAQIGHASAGSDHLCIVVGPAAKRHCLGAGLGSAGWKSRDGASGKIAVTAHSHKGAAQG